MVTRERLNKFIRQRCHEIGHQVRVFCSTHDGEALHLLRVEVKKLRAALVLLQQCTHNTHHHSKGIKELYKAAGAIRTAQVNLKVLEDLGQENQAFAAGQQRIIDEGSLAFCLDAPRYQKTLHKLQDEWEKDTVDIKPQKVRSLFAERIRKLSLFFSAANLDTVALHNTRKETKELMYMYALLPPALAASLPLNKDYLDRLQHSLGTWHDNTVTLSLLQGFSHTDPVVLEKLQQADGVLLQEIKNLTAGFDQNVRTAAETATLTGGNKEATTPGSYTSPPRLNNNV